MVLTVLLASASLRAQQTVALLVGNAKYKGQEHPTAASDLAAMKKTLEAMGVKVTVLENVREKKDLIEKSRTFALRVPTNATAIFYYSGHAFRGEVKRRIKKKWVRWTGNLLAPTGRSFKDRRDIERYAAPLPEILEGFDHGGASKTLIILNVTVPAAPKIESEKQPTGPADLKHIDARRFQWIAAARPSAAQIRKKLRIVDGSRLVARPTDGRRAGDVWVSDLGVVFCWIPPGKFTMGSPPDEALGHRDERPVEVTITRGFWIGKYELTNRELELAYRGRREGNPPRTANLPFDGAAYGAKFKDAFFKKQTARERKAGSIPENWGYTLPTEAEWEYAARAGTKTPYYFGSSADDLPRHANFADRSLYQKNDSLYRYAERSLDDGHGGVTRVGSYRSNAWGLHDVYGNVWEWCADHYGPKLPGGRDPLVRFKKDAPLGQVARGGSFISDATYCRSAFRRGFTHTGEKAAWYGVRLVLKPLPPSKKESARRK